ncbi:hypothetical protein, partial [Chryseobacterium gwangjuense]|uniref:hypothetical protein n=1 Tax=Chryseobacterium gwangjuense TaxID=1069980 RepID=UPI001E41EAE1
SNILCQMKGGQFGLEFGGQFDPKLVVNLLRKTLVYLTVFSRYIMFYLKNDIPHILKKLFRSYDYCRYD